MKNILFITTVFRTGEKVYPVVFELSKEHNIDVLNLYQMSSINIPIKVLFRTIIFINILHVNWNKQINFLNS